MAMSESDSSSLNSVELDGLGMAGAVDSDTGLESMSSAETPSGKPCGMCCCDAPNNDSRVEGLRQDVTRLKCDKLELLRQNVVSLFFPHIYLSLSLSLSLPYLSRLTFSLHDPLSPFSVHSSTFRLAHLFIFFYIIFSIFQSCQHEIKRLREKELVLQSELTSASKEILRLRELLKNYTTNPNSSTV